MTILPLFKPRAFLAQRLTTVLLFLNHVKNKKNIILIYLKKILQKK
jgi:hypothetical protein